MSRPTLVALLVLAAGCNKGGPSPEYRAALAEHARLVNALGQDAAYLDPKMDELLAALEQVPKSSDDYFGAQALLTRIRLEKSRVASEESKLAAVRADVRAPAPALQPTGYRGPAPVGTRLPSAAPANSAPLPGVAPAVGAPAGNATRYYCRWQGSRRANETACRNDSDCSGATCIGGKCVKGQTRKEYTVAEVGGSQWSGCYAANAASMSEAQRACEASARGQAAENVSCSCSTSPSGSDCK